MLDDLQEYRALRKLPLPELLTSQQKGGCWCILFPNSFCKAAKGKALLIV